MSRRVKWFGGLGTLAVALSIVLGIAAGLGTFTFVYAEGHSYLSNDPTACTNCHVMQQYYDSWLKSGHHHVAVCNDCHLPHDNLITKFWTKADNGFFHSLAFTLENFHEPIQIKERNRRVVQHNCVNCHRDMANHLLAASPNGEVLNCIHCHSSVGHGELPRTQVWTRDWMDSRGTR